MRLEILYADGTTEIKPLSLAGEMTRDGVILIMLVAPHPDSPTGERVISMLKEHDLYLLFRYKKGSVKWAHLVGNTPGAARHFRYRDPWHSTGHTTREDTLIENCLVFQGQLINNDVYRSYIEDYYERVATEFPSRRGV